MTATTPTETTTPSGSKPESSSEPSVSSSAERSIDLKPPAPPLNPSNVIRSKRENVRQKGARLLVSGRLRIVKVDGDLIIAECRGDSGGLYHLGRDPKAGQWRCTCEARTACSHLHALWAVTAVERS